MRTPDLIVVAGSVVIAAAGWAAAAYVRPTLAKDERAARILLAPLVVLVPALITALSSGVYVAAAPLGSAIAMTAAAAWILHPTAATRFARFERQFWTHVHVDPRHQRRDAA